MKHTNARSSLEHPRTLELTAAPVSPVYSNNWLGATTPSPIQAAQREDPNLLAVATWLEEDVMPQHCPFDSPEWYCLPLLEGCARKRHHPKTTADCSEALGTRDPCKLAGLLNRSSLGDEKDP